MSQKAISKLWAFFGLATLTLSFLFFLRSTGMDPKGEAFGILGYKATTIPALALPMDLSLMTVFLCLSLVWSRQVSGATWAHRQPIFYFDKTDVDPGTLGGRVYQGWAFFLTMVLPLVLAIQMAVRFFGGNVYVNCVCQNKQLSASCAGLCELTKSTSEVATGWKHFNFGRLSDLEVMLRFGATDGPQYFPVLPWVYSVWGLGLVAVWLFAAWSIFSDRQAVSQ